MSDEASIWEVVSAVGTASAVLLSLAISLLAWSAGARQRRVQRRIAAETVRAAFDRATNFIDSVEFAQKDGSLGYRQARMFARSGELQELLSDLQELRRLNFSTLHEANSLLELRVVLRSIHGQLADLGEIVGAAARIHLVEFRERIESAGFLFRKAN